MFIAKYLLTASPISHCQIETKEIYLLFNEITCKVIPIIVKVIYEVQTNQVHNININVPAHIDAISKE